jgi:hypothetical protein
MEKQGNGSAVALLFSARNLRTYATSVHPMLVAGAVYPFTEPAVKPRTKYRWSEKKTSRGTIIVIKAPAVKMCQS